MKKTKNYTLKILKDGKKIETIRTHSVHQFLRRLRRVNWQKGTSVYLRVSYGKKLDNFGKLSHFYNDGYYYNKKDLFIVFKAFNDEE